MCERPRPEMQRGAVGRGTPKSHEERSNTAEINLTTAELQARSLRRLYLFCRATACTIARLAFGVAG
jgi:hypothetical protein